MCILSRINAYYRKYDADRIVQGDILSEVKFRDWDWDTKKDNVIIYKKELPYIVILSQDCDLEWDFKYRTTAQKNDDKKLQSILVCPAYRWQEFIDGVHLKAYDLKMENISSTDQKKKIKQQQVPRFHYLAEDSDKQISPLVVDYIGSAEGHEYPDLQVGDEVNPRTFFLLF